MRKFIRGAVGLSAMMMAVAPVLAQRYYNDPADDAIFGSFMFFFYCCLCIFGIVAMGVQIYFLIDSFKRDYGEDDNMQIISILILLLLGFPFGTLIYYFLVMQKYPKKDS
jgi:hypothetical protein